MIHISKLNILTEKKDGNGNPYPFSFKAILLDGRIITGDNCIVTSSNHANRTRNVKWIDSNQFRKIRNISFIELNNVEVTL